MKIKRLLVTAVSALILASSFSIAAFADAKVLVGDVNGDGQVNIKDATYIQKVVAKLREEPENYLLTADVNSDNNVSVKDATVIQLYLAGFYDSLPITREQDTEPPTKATETTQAPTEATQPTTDDGWDPHIYQP